MAKARILVIDDDPLFRSLIMSMLRGDYLVTVAADGVDGYQKAREHPPQLAIIDVQMPGWDGLRTLQALRSHRDLAKLPVMMLTSDATRQAVLATVQAGANDYVIKTTLVREELLKKVSRLVNSGGAIRDNSEAAAVVDDSTTPATECVSDETAQGLDRHAEIVGSGTADDVEQAAVQAMVENWE